MMTKREVIKCVLDGKKPPYVPWSFKFTEEPKKMLQEHYGVEDLDIPLGNHILNLGSDIGFFEQVIVLDARVFEVLKIRYPSLSDKFILWHIVDPYGQGAKAFRKTAETIKNLIEKHLVPVCSE